MDELTFTKAPVTISLMYLFSFSISDINDYQSLYQQTLGPLLDSISW